MERQQFINTGNKDTRSGFGAGLSVIGDENPNVVAMCADLTGSLKMDAFAKAHPDRFYQAGIAEANMIGVGAGMALSGKIPFVGSFAAFATGRVYDQIRQSVAYSNTNVKIAASHAGITLGEDGATHQILEDIGLMRMLPNMVVLNPCDYNQTKAATIAAAKHVGPVYIRFGRAAVPVFNDHPDYKFEIGKGSVVREGKDVTIIATGICVDSAIGAAEKLAAEGIDAEVINICTIKPLDEELVLASAKKTGKVVTVEEHSVIGGLGSAVCDCLAEKYPVPVKKIGMQDIFGESGSAGALVQKYGLDADGVYASVKAFL